MMQKTRKIIALLLACLLLLTACGPKTPDPTQTTAAPIETTEPHSHAYVDGVCLCGDSNGLDGFAMETAAGLTEVSRENTENGMLLTSANPAGEAQGIRLTKEFDAVSGHYYELIYRFTSDVAGLVYFSSDNAVCYETNEFEVK